MKVSLEEKLDTIFNGKLKGVSFFLHFILWTYCAFQKLTSILNIFLIFGV